MSRKTGRTTRMLKNAYRAAAEGRDVYVIAVSNDHADVMRNMLYSEIAKDAHKSILESIKFETKGALTRFDFYTMTVPYAHKNCIFFLDHLVLEHEITRAENRLTMLYERLKDAENGQKNSMSGLQRSW